MLAEQRERVFAAPPGIERLRAAYASYFDGFEAHPLAARFVFLRGGTNTVARWWLDNPGLPRDDVVERLVDLTWSGLAPLGAEGRLMKALRRPRTRRR